ncbi:hypothetical protein C3Y87_01925 [Carbonactinospora thermoautotrophica]|uniref:Uncharacterized protein n=1 Tax=Carbonactinospora thermoautotrophica TaxID=1469144 RepID=A0A132NG09_9ACTN|nr:hypothetical protein [Carbonactinospora thermoautotrophica]KWX02307.1 hypothetical protein LI90_3350 [Carbonactinospora thermoautotrophica]KWX03476.1 hypothetical protein TH66_11285 [Carbonactinospora thermoautotrophica]KWX09054.1 hypothetical protein TR74_11935 [Carbonactinospora thermoautotrophica]MCX9190189.1 hypothetical protein [Carbonactinospora thermoautotrophica]
MRVYVPSTLPALAAAFAAGSIAPVPVAAYTVTPALREWYVSGDIEELEYVAMMDAARASLRLLDNEPLAPRRRVVIAADVPDNVAVPRADLERSLVYVNQVIPLAKWASVHVDDPEAVEDVRKAAAAIVAAELGDPDAEFIVAAAEDHELQWYATQEIPDLLR